MRNVSYEGRPYIKCRLLLSLPNPLMPGGNKKLAHT